MQLKGALVLALNSAIAIAVLSACGARASSLTPDRATELAMQACHISQGPTEGTSDPGLTRDSLSGGKGTWNYRSPFDDLKAKNEEWKSDATAAIAASQIDDKWRSLSEAVSFNSLFVFRFVSLREKLDPTDPALTDNETLMSYYPEMDEDGTAFNSNLSKIDLICDAIIQAVSQ